MALTGFSKMVEWENRAGTALSRSDILDINAFPLISKARLFQDQGSMIKGEILDWRNEGFTRGANTRNSLDNLRLL
jgi:hypothetical protein